MKPRQTHSLAMLRKWAHRMLGLVLAATALLPVACTRSWRYSSSAVSFCAVAGDFFYVVVEQETGNATTTTPSPCPKTISTPEHLYLYTLTYSLARKPIRPQQSKAVEFPLRGRLAEFSPVSGESLPQGLFACKRLQVPRTASLFTGLTPNMTMIEGGALPDHEAKTLQGLGFNTKRLQCHVDTGDGRWYLGFDPFSPGVQVSCPKKRILKERRFTANFGAIWDVARSRLLLPEDKLDGQLIGLPKTVTVWSYDKDTLTSVELLPAQGD